MEKGFFVTPQELQELEVMIGNTHFPCFRDGVPFQTWLIKIAQKGTIEVPEEKKEDDKTKK